MKKVLIVLLLLLVMLPIFAQGSKDTKAEVATDGGTLRLVWPSMGASWDPHAKASWTTFIWAQNVFEGALVLGDDGVFYPNVCNYEYDQENGLWVKLWVREGEKFSNGEAVTIEDVLASLQRTALFIAKFNTNFWDNVDSYSIENGVLTFKFKKYNVNSMYILAEQRPYNGVMPKAICDKYGKDQIMDPADCIGTGPYVLNGAKSELGTKAYFDRNPYYKPHEDSKDLNGYASPRRQHMENIEINFISDTNAAMMSLMAGENDVMQATPENMKVLKDYGYDFWATSTGSGEYIFFNCAREAVKDSNMRKAIAAAIDYDEVLFAKADQYYDGTYHSPIVCGDAYSQKSFAKADYVGKANTNVAAKYLKAANYDGKTVKLLAAKEFEAMAMIIQSRLKDAGINCELMIVDDASINATWGDTSLDWDFCIRTTALSLTTPSAIDQTFHFAWGNERAEELIKSLSSKVIGSKESVALWDELAALMADECPFAIFGTLFMDQYAYKQGLDLNFNGVLRYFFNARWTK